MRASVDMPGQHRGADPADRWAAHARRPRREARARRRWPGTRAFRRRAGGGACASAVTYRGLSAGVGACTGSWRSSVGDPPISFFSEGTYGKVGQELLVVAVDAVAQRQLLAALVGRDEVAADHAQRDVDDVVGQPPAVREAGVVAADDAEAVLASPTAARRG